MQKYLVMGMAVLVLAGVPAGAAAAARAVTYKNCTALNKVYPGGVARVGARNVGGKTRYTPFYNDALYLANKKSDRDKDGIACEQ